MALYSVITESKIVELQRLGKYLSFWFYNTSASVYKNDSYRIHFASLCNDIETNSRPPIPIKSSLLTEYRRVLILL